MPDHKLYLNLGDNSWLIARCGCDGWQQERMLKPGQRPSEVLRELEKHSISTPAWRPPCPTPRRCPPTERPGTSNEGHSHR